MAIEEYVVFQAASQRWGVQYRGNALVLFPKKAQAIRAAVSIAHAKATPAGMGSLGAGRAGGHGVKPTLQGLTLAAARTRL